VQPKPGLGGTALANASGCDNRRVSSVNVELARRGFDAIARGDVEALRAVLDPEVKWHGSDGPGRDSCHDRDEVLHFIRQAVRRGAVGELVEVIDAGDQVVVVMRPRREGRLDVAGLRANVTSFRAGKVVRIVAYETPEAALAATRA
jgi:ketosteroid isomerase-like protein